MMIQSRYKIEQNLLVLRINGQTLIPVSEQTLFTFDLLLLLGIYRKTVIFLGLKLVRLGNV